MRQTHEIIVAWRGEFDTVRLTARLAILHPRWMRRSIEQ